MVISMAINAATTMGNGMGNVSGCTGCVFLLDVVCYLLDVVCFLLDPVLCTTSPIDIPALTMWFLACFLFAYRAPP
jgi:hypothetical protein